nr:endonuclease/exonuclease/phosphatase family protein [Bacteriovorax sp. HI3]
MKLKILSSNIRFSNPADGVHNWEARMPLLVKLYQDFKPDILGTQEGRIGQLKELDDALPELVLVDSHRNWIDERMYPCLFVNPKTVKVEKSGDIWLSETPHTPGSSSFQSMFPRLCTWADVTFLENGHQMIIINTHLDHVKSETRQQQIEVLIKEIKSQSSREVIIMGDFNESPTTALQDTLVKSFNLKDPWKEKKLPEETSHHSFLGDKMPEGDRIDWILIPKSFSCEDIRLVKTTSAEGLFPSDHYPLLATVSDTHS